MTELLPPQDTSLLPSERLRVGIALNSGGIILDRDFGLLLLAEIEGIKAAKVDTYVDEWRAEVQPHVDAALALHRKARRELRLAMAFWVGTGLHVAASFWLAGWLG